jgi:hypothetical protein
MEVRGFLSPPRDYLAASAFFVARDFAASDIFFRVSAEIVLFFFDSADLFVAAAFFAGAVVFAAFLALRVYLRFCGAA